MNHAHLPHLLRRAADVIQENADVLKQSSTTADGDWPDADDQISYERDMLIVEQLRAAVDDAYTVYRTRAGLEQLLRAYRNRGTQIRYQDLAGLLPDTTQPKGEHHEPQ